MMRETQASSKYRLVFRRTMSRRDTPGERSRRRLAMQLLEDRRLLHGSDLVYDQVTPLWFQAGHEQRPSAELASTAVSPSSFIGPQRPTGSSPLTREEWIVRLSPQAAQQLDSITAADSLLDSEYVNFDVIRGLGLPGMLLVESFSSDADSAVAWLASNEHIADFSSNHRVVGAQVPNDPSFPDMTNLNGTGQFGSTLDADIDAPESWEITTGSTSMVVGVIDSGIDVTHADLYLNIWLNQGEIPAGTKGQLSDLDGDGLITLWDLNNLRVVDSQVYVASTVSLDQNGELLAGSLASIAQMTTATPFAAGANGTLVEDINGNGRIDAADLLGDARWADAEDSDGNGFTDDLFGWNFRSDSDEPYASNNPSDEFGHGTHVAGTIGAVGNNGVGITGVNWQSSIMPIKFLDAQNRGSQADAIAAINYATMMRSQYGVNVRITNNSWGQPGNENPLLRAAIAASGEAGILFVAAAGNGDAIASGSNLDLAPHHYPASYDLPNVISVAASDWNDQLAAFSNFGVESIDIAAPGVGVLSTLPGDRYGAANGTSVAAAQVSAAAALIWSVRPTATAEEVRQAILAGVDVRTSLQDKVASGGRLSTFNAIQSDVFNPAALVVSAENITAAGGTSHEIEVQYHYPDGIDPTSLGDDDLRVSRRWGTRDQISATLVAGSVTSLPDGETVSATYEIAAPGGSWDPLDYGNYDIEILPNSVSSSSGLQFVTGQGIGSFHVRIDAADVIYVTTTSDSVDANVGDGVCFDASGACSLRAAIQEANAAAPLPRTIILEVGEASVTIPHQADPSSAFPNSNSIDGLPNVTNVTGWSNEATGDLDILGDITIVGDQTSVTKISGGDSDRIFKVHPNGSLSLQRLTITGGLAPGDQGGGGILSAGVVDLDQVVISANASSDSSNGLGGGGIAIWGGSIRIHQSTIAGNSAEIGGGLLVSNGAAAAITQSTFANNVATVGSGLATPDLDLIGGGGIVAIKSDAIDIENTTFSANTAVNAAGAAIGVFSLAPIVMVDSVDVPLAIPDKGMTTSQLTVSGFDDVVSDVNVKLTINHTFNGDLNVFLISPIGTRVELFTDVGSGSNNFLDTILDDDSLTDINSGSGPFSGSFRPEGSLADLIGEDPNGIWQLEITDTTANDIGTLQSWSLELEPEEGSSAKGNLNHVTAAFHDGASTIAGRVRLHSSLLAGDVGVALDPGVSDRGFNVIADGQSVGPLQFLGGPTLAHPLHADNPAIDGADSADFPQVDQVGTPRPQRGADFSTRPDVGAVEMAGGFAGGLVYLDRNGDAARDGDEIGLAGFTIFIDTNDNGQLDPEEPHVITGDGDEAGTFLFSNLAAGPHSVYLQVPENWTVSHQDTLLNVRMSSDDDDQRAPALSFDGNTVAFYSDQIPASGPVQTKVLVLNRKTESYYSPNFVDEFGFPPIEIPYVAFDFPSVSADGHYVVFLDTFDHPFIPGPHDSIEVVDTRVTDAISAGFSVASELTGFSPSDGMISLDGRYVAFTSGEDIYVFDRQQELISQVTQAFDGSDTNGASFNASISQEGRYVVFESAASNLIQSDTNEHTDVFVVDRMTQMIQRVSVANDGTQSSADSSDSSISSDGRYVVFASAASELVSDDQNQTSDIFVFDRQVNTIQRITQSVSGQDSDGPSENPAISGNGRFLVFESAATNLIDDDSNSSVDVFLMDRQSNTTIRIAESSHSPFISGDGKFIAYVQGSETLVVNNPLAPIVNRTVILGAGETATADGFGIVPAAGEIRGTLFEDLVFNSARDVADPSLEGWTVYLDLSQNGQLDVGEPQAVSDVDGSYVLPNVPGHADHTVLVDVPSGWRQVSPDASVSPGREVFVNAGQTVVDLDLGFRRSATDQSKDGSVSGVVFRDLDQDGIRQAEEPVVADATVFLDLNDDSMMQPEEPSTITHASGFYSINSLGKGDYTVRVLLPENTQNSLPLGNAFETASLAARSGQGVLAGLYDLLLVDLDGDTQADLVTAVYESNLISIRAHDGSGSFDSSAVNVSVFPDGTGPIAVAAGDLNQQGSIDLVVVNHLSGTVTVLLDFNGNGFDVVASYDVGLQPSDIAMGDFDGLNGLDFAVSNAGSDSITLMMNDGSGNFSSAVLASGGKRPTALMAGHFNDDTNLDLAIANYGDHPSGSDLGNVAILINQGNATFATPTNYQVGFGPSGFAAADLNGDDQIDLAVAGFLSNDVSLLLGSASGTFDDSSDPISVVEGPLQVEASDFDNDGDIDLLAVGASRQQVSILRNALNRGAFAISPPENVSPGLGVADERSTFAVADINQDGRDDIVTTGLSGETVSLLHNVVAGGAYRLALTGTEAVTGLDFGIFASSIDSIVLQGAGETVDMAALDPSLRASVKTIDIRGTGDNTLILDAPTIQTQTPNQTLLAISDAGDQVIFDDGWRFSGVETVEGRFQRIFVNGAATLRLIGPRSWTNPIIPSDVNGSGAGTAADALAIINALSPRIVIDSQNNLVDPTTIDPSRFKFYDANRDGRMSASDALFVINRIGRIQSNGEAEQSLTDDGQGMPDSKVRESTANESYASAANSLADELDEVFSSTWHWR